MARISSLCGMVVILGLGVPSLVSTATYSKNHKHSSNSSNAGSSVIFEPRGDVGGGGGGYGSSFGSTGGSYGVPSGGHDHGGHGGDHGGGYGGGGGQATAFKYQIYPAMSGYGGGGGWGGGGGKGGGWGMEMGGGWGEDEEGGGIDKGLLGLLGLKGLLPLLKGALLLKKAGLLPLLPILLPFLLPILLPFLLLAAAFLLLPLLLLLLIPIPVITTGRKFLENAQGGKSVKLFIQEVLDDLLPKLPQDLNHIIEKIRTKSMGGIGSDLEGPKAKTKDNLVTPEAQAARSTSTQSHSVTTSGSFIQSLARDHPKPVKFVKPQTIKSKTVTLK